MIHIEFGPSTIVGVGLTVVGILLYLIRTKKPIVSRDYDLLFSSLGLLCGGILIFQGWRLDPILLLCQMLSSGTAIFFIAETLSLRNTQSTDKNTLPFSSRLQDYKRLSKSQHMNTKLNWLGFQQSYYFNKFNRFNYNYKLINSTKKDYTTPIEYITKFIDSQF
uniref:Hypothetical chloroplast RF66 n=1 Tax=Zygnema circumcarinatum TaxID=35869 RepID=Q32RP4_ZYGCR|nr:hypothetical chloroplast RF66 [Zygnema circumcarinatum]AAX45882.1 hypothetical chloroplast RF66 [Zygnema circumcarinatum]